MVADGAPIRETRAGHGAPWGVVGMDGSTSRSHRGRWRRATGVLVGGIVASAGLVAGTVASSAASTSCTTSWTNAHGGDWTDASN
jgi:hypothetical protein